MTLDAPTSKFKSCLTIESMFHRFSVDSQKNQTSSDHIVNVGQQLKDNLILYSV